MDSDEFYWGPLARGIYMALLFMIVLVALFWTSYLLYYLILMAFLGFGLRPLLVKTGLYRLAVVLLEKHDSRRWRKFTLKRRQEIERKQRDDRYRGRHHQDSRLPKNW